MKTPISFQGDIHFLANGAGMGPDEISGLYKSRLERMKLQLCERQRQVRGVLFPASDKEVIYLSKLVSEALSLYVEGYFYGCVAMCGIAAERIAKDLYRRNVQVLTESGPQPPSEDALEAFEKAEAMSFIAFCAATGIIREDERKKLKRLSIVRNEYVHSAGKSPEKDAEEAVLLLGSLVEDIYGNGFNSWSFENKQWQLKRVATAPINNTTDGEAPSA